MKIFLFILTILIAVRFTVFALESESAAIVMIHNTVFSLNAYRRYDSIND